MTWHRYRTLDGTDEIKSICQAGYLRATAADHHQPGTARQGPKSTAYREVLRIALLRDAPTTAQTLAGMFPPRRSISLCRLFPSVFTTPSLSMAVLIKPPSTAKICSWARGGRRLKDKRDTTRIGEGVGRKRCRFFGFFFPLYRPQRITCCPLYTALCKSRHTLESFPRPKTRAERHFADESAGEQQNMAQGSKARGSLPLPLPMKSGPGGRPSEASAAAPRQQVSGDQPVI